MKILISFVLGLALTAQAKTPATIAAKALVGHFALDWNKGPGQYVCTKVEVSSDLYKQMEKATCAKRPGKKALSPFDKSYAECFSGEHKHFNWMVFPTEKICEEQVVSLNLPSP